MTTISVPRPAVHLDDPLYAEHFRRLAEGRLAIRRCTNCDACQWPPREMCGSCQHTDEFEWIDVPAEGELYTFAVMYRPFHPGFADAVPYGIAVADLVPGIRFFAIYDGDPEELRCGMRLVGGFRTHGDSPELVWRAG